MKINRNLFGVLTAGALLAGSFGVASFLSGCNKPSSSSMIRDDASFTNADKANKATVKAEPTAKDYLADLEAHGLKAEYLGRLAADVDGGTTVDCRMYRLTDPVTRRTFYVATNDHEYGSCGIAR